MACVEISQTLAAAGLSLAGLGDAGLSVDAEKAEAFADWAVAEYDFSHPHFDTDWRRKQVAFTNDTVTISLEPHAAGLNPFVAGSVRRESRTHFGRYSADLKPARGEGLVTGFFVYTGAAYGTQHDEIDIEFLGKDTTQLHAATFVDGVLSNWFIDLGFDAADEMRRYGFDWYPDKIIWHVDGCEVFRVTEAETPIPQTPSFLFANLWAVNPGLNAWAGVPAADATGQSLFAKLRFTPLLDEGSTDATEMTASTAPASLRSGG